MKAPSSSTAPLQKHFKHYFMERSESPQIVTHRPLPLSGWLVWLSWRSTRSWQLTQLSRGIFVRDIPGSFSLRYQISSPGLLPSTVGSLSRVVLFSTGTIRYATQLPANQGPCAESRGGQPLALNHGPYCSPPHLTTIYLDVAQLENYTGSVRDYPTRTSKKKSTMMPLGVGSPER